jgi:hypothetical protein
VAAAWFCSLRISYILAILLPIGRLWFLFVNGYHPAAPNQILTTVLRIGVLMLMAYLVERMSRQNRELKARVDSLVMICAWSRTVKHEDEWLSFEEYLQRRFKVNTTHGISPAEAERLGFKLTSSDLKNEPVLSEKASG